MKCSNPACTSEKFLLQVEHRLVEQPDRLPVKATCAHCGKPVKAYITNTQMKDLMQWMKELTAPMEEVTTAMIRWLEQAVPRKRGWKERIFGR